MRVDYVLSRSTTRRESPSQKSRVIYRRSEEKGDRTGSGLRARSCYGVRFHRTYRLKEHGSRRTAGAATCHLQRRKPQTGSHSSSKVRPRSRNALWRTMFLHFALLGAGGHAAQLCCKRCAQAAQPAPLPRSGSAVLNRRPRTSHSLGSCGARRNCAWTSCSNMPAGPSITPALQT